jgi:hypothetical protein
MRLGGGDMAGIGGKRCHDANRRGEGGGGGGKRKPVRQQGHGQCFPQMPPVGGSLARFRTYGDLCRPDTALA